MTSFENIAYELEAGVATITLNRPDQLNPITHGPGSMHDEMLQAFELASADERARCIVLTGAGRAFSAGGSVRDLDPHETAASWVGFHAHNNELNDRIRAQSKPVIGAINGICYGAGFIIAMHLDILIASDRARFGLIETRFGAPGVDTLALLVGPQWAKFLALSGELIDAHRAKEIGLVLEVVPDDRFSERVQDLAGRVAAMPPDTVMLNKRLINGAMEMLGWTQQKQLTVALNSIANSVMDRAATPDGRRFIDILDKEGWSAFKQARDEPFKQPWLDSWDDDQAD